MLKIVMDDKNVLHITCIVVLPFSIIKHRDLCYTKAKEIMKKSLETLAWPPIIDFGDPNVRVHLDLKCTEMLEEEARKEKNYG